MVRSIHVTILARTQIDFCSCYHQAKNSSLILIVVFLAFALPPSVCFSQEVKPMNPPTTTANSDQPKSDAAPEVKVALKTLSVDLRGKELSFQVPENWKAKKPRFNFTKHDLRLSKADGDEKDARMTFTISSGSTQSNIDRWKAQFKFAVDAAPDKVFTMEKKTVDGYELSLVQIRGTFMETMGGPFAGGKKTPRENHLMKAVIISPPGADAKTPKCFIKLVGSEKTINLHAESYTAMVNSMRSQAAVE